jgi:hypothetical protein
MGKKIQVGNTFIPAIPIRDNTLSRAIGSCTLFGSSVTLGLFVSITFTKAAHVDDIWQVQ